MRSYAFAVLLFPALAVCRLFEDGAYLQDSTGTSNIARASPASVPTSGAPTATSVSTGEILELRQAAGVAPQPAPANPAAPAPVNPAPANPAVPAAAPAAPAPVNPQNPGIAPVNNPVPAAAPVPVAPAPVAAPANPIAPAAPQVANAVNPVLAALTMTSAVLGSPAANYDYVSVQWVETWIGGTSQTWVPKTISFHFKPYMTQAPLPGKGEIGMGTLTGEPGKTKTVMLGAAPTQAAGWRGAAAALGVGVVGMMV